MNPNVHTQYLNQHLQPNTQNASSNKHTQSISHMLMQQQQIQRQKIINQHLHHQQQISNNNEQNMENNMNSGSNNQMEYLIPNEVFSNMNQGLPILQLQQQQQPIDHLSLNLYFYELYQPLRNTKQLPIQSPVINEVWSYNLEKEFHSLRTFINDKNSKIFVAYYQEIPGMVAKPIYEFESLSDYHFQTLRSNVDILKIIQISLCVIKVKKNEIGPSVIWQFNFEYDISAEMYNEDHMKLLTQSSALNLSFHLTQGIKHVNFAELMIESGLLLDDSIKWIFYNAGYDLTFCIRLFINSIFPDDDKMFYEWCSLYFPNIYDLKYILTLINKTSEDLYENSKNKNNKKTIESLAEDLNLFPISPIVYQHFFSAQFSTHQCYKTCTFNVYLMMECFKKLLIQNNYDVHSFDKFKSHSWGIENLDLNENSDESDTIDVNSNNFTSENNTKRKTACYGNK